MDPGVGIVTPGAIKAMALSHKVYLFMRDHGEKVSKSRISRSDVRDLNFNVAVNSDQFVIARDKLHLEYIVKRTKIDTYVRTKRIEIS